MAAAKKAAKKQSKKPAAKKQAGGKAGGNTGGKVVPLIEAPVRTDEQVDEIIDRRSERAEKWAQAWQMHAIGVPYRVIAQRMGLLRPSGEPDHKEAIRFVRNHERLVDGDPDRVSDRAEIVARLDLAIEKQLAELTQLEAAEQRRKRRWDAQDREAGIPAELSEFQPVPVWLENSDGLLKALAAKQRVVAPHSPQKQVTVELAAAASDGAVMPGALAGVIARVTVTDEEGAA